MGIDLAVRKGMSTCLIILYVGLTNKLEFVGRHALDLRVDDWFP